MELWFAWMEVKVFAIWAMVESSTIAKTVDAAGPEAWLHYLPSVI